MGEITSCVFSERDIKMVREKQNMSGVMLFAAEHIIYNPIFDQTWTKKERIGVSLEL